MPLWSEPMSHHVPLRKGTQYPTAKDLALITGFSAEIAIGLEFRECVAWGRGFDARLTESRVRNVRRQGSGTKSSLRGSDQ